MAAGYVFPIQAKTPTGNVVELWVWPYSTALWLKELVAKRLNDGTPVENPRLIFFGRQL